MAVDANSFANLTANQKVMLETYHTFGQNLVNSVVTPAPEVTADLTHKQATRVLQNVSEIVRYLQLVELAAKYIINYREEQALDLIRADSNA